MSDKKILVTGGAGYIGSHLVRLLTRTGKPVVVLDNLSTGFEDALLGAELVVGDTGDPEVVTHLLDEHKVDTVVHFAA
ncbi:MAG TPA: NAD-dependent epimerase/dehydratase family protein, partial [Gammaproteobacteria bacterium]|nr:NAD-dependent epimerase/dehydratase family protein [Gammaproteobacteria bacterium]